MQTVLLRLSLAVKLGKPFLSLYGTEWGSVAMDSEFGYPMKKSGLKVPSDQNGSA
jgi:hypothetical protein